MRRLPRFRFESHFLTGIAQVYACQPSCYWRIAIASLIQMYLITVKGLLLPGSGSPQGPHSCLEAVALMKCESSEITT